MLPTIHAAEPRPPAPCGRRRRRTSFEQAKEQTKILSEGNHRCLTPDSAGTRANHRSEQRKQTARAIGGESVSENREAAKTRGRIRKGLIAAYEAYQRREPASMDALMVKVREFAYMKVYHLEFEFNKFGSAETADDWAQEISIKVWQGLEKFDNDPRSTPESFYSWVHKIAFNQGLAAFNDLKKQKREKVGLTVKPRDEFGSEEEEEDNPEIYESKIRDSFIRIPASVTGIDLNICKMLLTKVRGKDGHHRGRNYAEVARALNMTEASVKMRLNRLKMKIKAEEDKETEEKRARLAEAEAEKRDSITKGLAMIRGQDAMAAD
jgi:RNA polymerase sigma factor (sigma-70 family)